MECILVESRANSQPGDSFAGGELEERGAIETARDLKIDVLDAGGMTKASRSGARFELLLPPSRHFVFEQQAEPLRVIKAARFGLAFEFLEPLGDENLRKMPNSGRTVHVAR